MSPSDSALVDIGNGVGAGFRNGNVWVITGPEYDEIVRERRDGPRWAEALRDQGFIYSGRMSDFHMDAPKVPLDDSPFGQTVCRFCYQRALPDERERGIPVGWFATPGEAAPISPSDLSGG